MDVTIYHNPRCSKSRETLTLIENLGIEPLVVRYLETPPDAATIRKLLGQLDVPARELIRSNEAAYRELGLEDTSLPDDQLIAAITTHPELLQRPIVVVDNKARIGRPPETVLEIINAS